MNTPLQQPGWDAARGQARWEGFSEAERQQKLADAEPLLLAAQGLKLNADGTAVPRQAWRNLETETRKPMTDPILLCRFCGRPIEATPLSGLFWHSETREGRCHLEVSLLAQPTPEGAFQPAPCVTGNDLIAQLVLENQRLFGELERVADLWEQTVDGALILRRALEQIQQVLKQASADLPQTAVAPDAQSPVTGEVNVEVLEHRSQTGELIGQVLPFGGQPISGKVPGPQRMERHISKLDGSGQWMFPEGYFETGQLPDPKGLSITRPDENPVGDSISEEV